MVCAHEEAVDLLCYDDKKTVHKDCIYVGTYVYICM